MWTRGRDIRRRLERYRWTVGIVWIGWAEAWSMDVRSRLDMI